MPSTMTRVEIDRYRLNVGIVRKYLNERFPRYVVAGQDNFDVKVRS